MNILRDYKIYQNSYWDALQLMIIDKEKQKEDIVQDKVLLYKLYSILIFSPSKTLSLNTQMLQDGINLEKALKLLQ